MKRTLNLLLTIFIVTACSLDENSLRPEQQKPITFIDNQKIINEVVKLRNDLFGLPTKSLGDIEVTALTSTITRSSNITPYVINYPNNGGFAVLATDGENITTIAITNSGNLPPEILQSALGAPSPSPFPINPPETDDDDDELLLDDPDDVTYGDEHLEPYPLDIMPFTEPENGPGLVVSPEHPAIGMIVGSLGEISWDDDNLITNPNMPGIPTTPPVIDSTTIIDSSLIGVWLDGHGVRPLIQTKWNQNGIYQQSCPIMPDGNYAYVGCSGVATGQIVAALAPPHLPYDFERLTQIGNKDDPSCNTSSPADNDYVANYLRYIADGIKTQYGSDGSSSTRWKVKRFLKNTIGLENVKIHNNWNMSKFVERIEGRLRYHLPIYIRGGIYNEDEGDKDWHAYIIDGYMRQIRYNNISGNNFDTRTLYHINWGYGGSGDGYYNIRHWEQGLLATDENIDPNTNDSYCFNRNIRIITYKTPYFW